MALIYSLISYGIIFGAVFNQLPQIYKIYQNQSIEGISFQAIYIETLMLVFNVGYNLYEQTEFMLYGENFILFLEYLIVLGQFCYYSKNSQGLLKKICLLCVISFLLLLQIMPAFIFEMSIYINMILLILSRFPQIKLNYQRKSTGQLAFLTHLQNQAGAIPRALSVFAESNNVLLHSLMILDNLLVLLVTIQFLLYWKSNKVRYE